MQAYSETKFQLDPTNMKISP